MHVPRYTRKHDDLFNNVNVKQFHEDLFNNVKQGSNTLQYNFILIQRSFHYEKDKHKQG